MFSNQYNFSTTKYGQYEFMRWDDVITLITNWLRAMTTEISEKTNDLAYLGCATGEYDWRPCYRWAWSIAGYDDYCLYCDLRNQYGTSEIQVNTSFNISCGIARMSDSRNYGSFLTRNDNVGFAIYISMIADATRRYTASIDFSYIATNGKLTMLVFPHDNEHRMRSVVMFRDEDGYGYITSYPENSDSELQVYSEKDVEVVFKITELSNMNFSEMDKCIVISTPIRYSSNNIATITDDVKIINGAGITDTTLNRISVNGVKYRQIRNHFFIKDDE